MAWFLWLVRHTWGMRAVLAQIKGRQVNGAHLKPVRPEAYHPALLLSLLIYGYATGKGIDPCG
jgi:hypothetical protein